MCVLETQSYQDLRARTCRREEEKGQFPPRVFPSETKRKLLLLQGQLFRLISPRDNVDVYVYTYIYDNNNNNAVIIHRIMYRCTASSCVCVCARTNVTSFAEACITKSRRYMVVVAAIVVFYYEILLKNIIDGGGGAVRARGRGFRLCPLVHTRFSVRVLFPSTWPRVHAASRSQTGDEVRVLRWSGVFPFDRRRRALVRHRVCGSSPESVRNPRVRKNITTSRPSAHAVRPIVRRTRNSHGIVAVTLWLWPFFRRRPYDRSYNLEKGNE